MNDIPNVTLNNGVQMPQLGLGVFLMPSDITADNVAAAIQNGYRLIDTAAMYGNEAAVGEGIRKSGVPREQLFITTKLWNSDHGFDNVAKAFETSMQKLSLEYLDLYLMHWPHPARGQMVETWKAMEQLYKGGRIKSIGVCNFQPHHLDELLQKSETVPAVLQIELHPTFTQEAVRAYAKRYGIQVESWAPLGGQKSIADLLGNLTLVDIAKKYSKTSAQVVLRWHIQQGLVVIPKSDHVSRIIENRDIFDFELTSDELAAISDLNTGVRLGPDPDAFDRE